MKWKGESRQSNKLSKSEIWETNKMKGKEKVGDEIK